MRTIIIRHLYHLLPLPPFLTPAVLRNRLLSCHHQANIHYIMSGTKKTLFPKREHYRRTETAQGVNIKKKSMNTNCVKNISHVSLFITECFPGGSFPQGW